MSSEPAEPDPLDELRVRLRATQEAAERIAERVPSQGWATPDARDATAQDVRALVDILHALRDLLPAELAEQVREVIRQLLLLLRAVLDAVVARLAQDGADRSGARAAAPPATGPQDIPIS